MMTADQDTLGEVEAFSLLGGTLHRLGCRLGLVRNDTNTLRLGLALALFDQRWVRDENRLPRGDAKEDRP